ncbi:MAG: transferase [Hyphomicrobiales bacterium]|nr:transferase [Hyphomicrobiales bacterium]
MSGGKITSPEGAAPSDRPLGECPPGYRPTPAEAAIDARIVEMRAHLARMRPASDAEALKALRHAFPDVSLAVRVAAMTRASRS